LQVERRLIYSEDPFFPALTLVGTLPKLTLHANENKIINLRAVLSAFRDNRRSPAQAPHELYDVSYDEGSSHYLPEEKLGHEPKPSQERVNMQSTGRLFIAKFTIKHASLDVQFKGRNVAELQVFGTEAVLNHREDDTEFQFVIHSLLLADAMQKFGPDFQLLLASHKHVW